MHRTHNSGFAKLQELCLVSAMYVTRGASELSSYKEGGKGPRSQGVAKLQGKIHDLEVSAALPAGRRAPVGFAGLHLGSLSAAPGQARGFGGRHVGGATTCAAVPRKSNVWEQLWRSCMRDEAREGCSGLGTCWHAASLSRTTAASGAQPSFSSKLACGAHNARALCMEWTATGPVSHNAAMHISNAR